MSEPKKLAIIQDFESPPGGWKYVVPETGIELKAPYAKSLKQRIAAHLNANGLPMPDSDVLDDAICRQSGHGEPWCGGAVKAASENPLLTMATVNRFLRTVLQAVKDRKFVDTVERERRLAICQACPMHTTLGTGCRGCNAVLKAISKVIPIEEGGLNACRACGCATSVKAVLDLDTLKKAEGSNRPPYAQGCWMLSDP
jgi:hypothetical protein